MHPTSSAPVPRSRVDAVRAILDAIPAPFRAALDERPPTVTVVGDDVSVSMDLSDVTVPMEVTVPLDPDAFGDEPDEPEPPTPTDTTRVPGLVRELSMRAMPLTIGRTDVSFDGTASDVPITWLEHADGTVSVGEADPHRTWTGSGYARVSIRTAHIERLLRDVVTATLAADDPKIRLTRLRVRLTQTDDRAVHVCIAAGIRRGLLAGSAHASGTVTLDAQHVLRIERPRIGTGNPIVALLLLFVRRRALESVQAFSADLDASLPADMRLHDVRVAIARDTELSFRIIGTAGA